MNIHSHAVAHTMGEELVIGAESRLGDHFAGSRIYHLALDSSMRRLQSCRLRNVNDVENFLHLLGRLTND